MNQLTTIESKTINLFKTQHGWFARFSDNEDRRGNNPARSTAFTRHAKGVEVERAIADLNPGYTIFVIGG